jgi:hypothetical protein
MRPCQDGTLGRAPYEQMHPLRLDCQEHRLSGSWIALLQILDHCLPECVAPVVCLAHGIANRFRRGHWLPLSAAQLDCATQALAALSRALACLDWSSALPGGAALVHTMSSADYKALRSRIIVRHWLLLPSLGTVAQLLLVAQLLERG